MNAITTNRRRAALLLVGTLGLTAALGACGTSTPDATVTPGALVANSSGASSLPSSSMTPTTGATSPSGTSTDALLGSVTVSPEQAADAALAAVSSSRVVGIELDREQSRVVWDVDVVAADAKREVVIDAIRGTILANRVTDRGDDAAEDHRHLAGAKVDHAAALQAALGEVPGARVVELDLDEEHGAVRWHVEVLASTHAKHEVSIDAATGKVVKHEVDD